MTDIRTRLAQLEQEIRISLGVDGFRLSRWADELAAMRQAVEETPQPATTLISIVEKLEASREQLDGILATLTTDAMVLRSLRKSAGSEGGTPR